MNKYKQDLVIQRLSDALRALTNAYDVLCTEVKHLKAKNKS